MFKKLIKNFKLKIRNYFKKYPTNLDLYTKQFSANDWSVIKVDYPYPLSNLRIHFKEHLIATTKSNLNRRNRENHIVEINMIEGFESLRSEVEIVLFAASQEMIKKNIDEKKKIQDLINQAKNETKWLGPFK